MRVLITGGEGFVGKTYQNTYHGEHEIVSLDNCEPHSTTSGIDFMKVDIAEEINISDTQFDGIIHLGGISRVKDGEISPRTCFEINVQGTVNVLDCAVRHHIPWVIVGSTIEEPTNAYGLSKKIANDISSYYSTRGVKVGIVKFSSIYGNTGDNQGKLIPILVNRAIEDKDIIINDAGLSVDFIHVQDVVKGLNMAANFITSKSHSWDYFEVTLSSGINTTLGELAVLIKNTFRSDSNIIIKNRNEHEDVNYKSEEFDKFIGSFPRTTLKQGLELLRNNLS